MKQPYEDIEATATDIDVSDAKALRDRRATGCHFDTGLCACPGAPYEYEGCKARQ